MVKFTQITTHTYKTDCPVDQLTQDEIINLVLDENITIDNLVEIQLVSTKKVVEDINYYTTEVYYLTDLNIITKIF